MADILQVLRLDEAGLGKREMFCCLDCGYRSRVFQVEVAGCDYGALNYRARCPKCSSVKVNVMPGPHEDNLRISCGLPSEGIWPLILNLRKPQN